jgi:hypothetical protein
VGESRGSKTEKDCAGKFQQQFTGQTHSEEVYDDRAGDRLRGNKTRRAKWLIANNCEFLQMLVDKKNQYQINPFITCALSAAIVV